MKQALQLSFLLFNCSTIKTPLKYQYVLKHVAPCCSGFSFKMRKERKY